MHMKTLKKSPLEHTQPPPPLSFQEYVQALPFQNFWIPPPPLGIIL